MFREQKGTLLECHRQNIAIFEVNALSSGTGEPNGMDRLYRVLDWGV